MIYTTLELCKEKHACVSGYRTLKKSLKKGHEDSDLIPLTHLIESNSIQDAIWALRATTEPCRDFITDFALWCAEQVLDIYETKYPNDKRVRECLEGIVKYRDGEISKEDLMVLRRAATATADAAADDADANVAAYTAAAAAAAAADANAAWAADAAANAAAYAAAYAAADDMREAQKQKFIEMLNEHKEK